MRLTVAMHLVQVGSAHLLPANHALFGNCHASSLAALPGNELLAAFFAGEREGTADCAIWLSRMQHGAWLPPARTFAEPGLPHWNPVLHAEGARVWLFYKVGATVHDWTTRIATSDDAGLTWDTPRELVPGDPTPRGPVRNKLLVLSDGAWLAPGSIETSTHWDAITDRSTDQGRTWTRADIPLLHLEHHPTVSGQPSDKDARQNNTLERDPPGTADSDSSDHALDTKPPRDTIWPGLASNALWETDLDTVFRWDGVIQPTLWESAPNQIHMLLRSTRGRVFRSDSTDGGRSWNQAYPTALPNNNSGLDLTRLPDGTLLLAYNPIEGNWGSRTPISLAASNDEGETWERLLDMETGEGEFSYPAIITQGGQIHVTYTTNRRNIAHRWFKRA